MNELVNNLKGVFHDRLEKVSWMTEPTRARRWRQVHALPRRRLVIRTNSAITQAWSSSGMICWAMCGGQQYLRRGGKLRAWASQVDRTEWGMTPETVKTSYFNPEQNEIVFPAGILQPPFFDITKDDAVNYGGIGVVIGH